MIANTKWSREAWNAAAPVYDRIISHPFITGIIDGSLPYERFIFYLRQDELYIRRYSRVLAHIASRADDMKLTADFLGFAQDGVAVEQSMHSGYLDGHGEAGTMTPTCMLYTSVLDSLAGAPLAVEVAGILPCFWIYWAVGQYILQHAGSLDNNPYRKWIETYADQAFTSSNQRAIDICDALAEQSTPAVRRAMTDQFVLCTRLEWMFWESAYRMEGWPV